MRGCYETGWASCLRCWRFLVSVSAARGARSVQFQFVAIHRMGGLLAAVVFGRFPRRATHGGSVEQFPHRRRRHYFVDYYRNFVRLWFVEAQLPNSIGIVVSFACYSRDRQWHFAASFLPMDFSIPERASRNAHGDSRSYFFLHCLCRDRGDGAAAE